MQLAAKVTRNVALMSSHPLVVYTTLSDLPQGLQQTFNQAKALYDRDDELERKTLCLLVGTVVPRGDDQPAATSLQDQLCQNDYKIEWLAGHPKFAFRRHLLARPSERRCK